MGVRVFDRLLGLNNRGRHASCSGHYFHVTMSGWQCCGCGDKVSSRRSDPVSTGECRRGRGCPGSAGRDGEHAAELLGGLAVQVEEKTERIAPSKLARVRLAAQDRRLNAGGYA